jgi:hypothetical protein
MIKFRIVFFLLMFPVFSRGQEINISERISAIAEELAADEDDPAVTDLYSDRLYELVQEPVKINSGNEDEISRLFFLTAFQVQVLIDYVKTAGGIVSPYEIAGIPGFDRETTEMMIPFITFENSSPYKKETVRLKHTLLSGFSLKSSISDTAAPGSAWKTVTKYKFTTGNFTGGLTMEKDPGEKLFDKDPPFVDFFSGYLAWRGSGLIKKVIIGDFSARFGQGTGINTGLKSGLSLTTTGYLTCRNEIRPYTSTEENNFFRGIAAEFSLKKMEISTFFSSNRIDATLNKEGSSITSLYKSGLHNSEGTLLKKDAAREISYGFNFSWNLNKLRTGVLWTENRFSLPMIPEQANPLNLNSFQGDKNSLYTIYYNYLFKRFNFYGEFSSSGSKKYAFVQGVSVRPSDRLNINFLYRHYSQGYVSFHGSGPLSSSSGKNESAILGNFTFEAAKYLFISAGSEIRYFPWLRYRCSVPSTAKKHEVRIRYLPSERLSLETLYNYKSSLVDINSESGMTAQEEVNTRSVKGVVKYSPADNIFFATRIDFKIADPHGSRGSMLMQDISIRFRKIPVSIWTRYCIFNTEGFESGIYTWENDLLNSFNIPVLYGSGKRHYIMISWKPMKNMEIRFKYGLTSREDALTAEKNIREYKFQLKIDI